MLITNICEHNVQPHPTTEKTTFPSYVSVISLVLGGGHLMRPLFHNM